MHAFDFINVPCVIIAVTVIIFIYVKWSFFYWQRKGVPVLPTSFPFGNIGNPFWTEHTFGCILKSLYDGFKTRNVKFGGIYFMTRPVFVPVDPEMVRNVLAKDFRYFHERGFYYNEKGNPLSAHIFAVEGSKWKFLRTKVTPTFTSGKMKLMFHTVVDCTDSLVKAVEKQAFDQTPIDIKEMLGCFTTDVIGSCAFGLECNSFVDGNAEFRRNGRKIFKMTLKKTLDSLITFCNPDLARRLNILALGGEANDFFLSVVKSNYDFRLKNNFIRNDFFQLLIDVKRECEENGENFTIENLAAQCFLFFIAGFETSSTATTFAFYELAKNPEVQNRARFEVQKVLEKHNGKITYEAIQEMKFLRCVFDEALRMYPPLPVLFRKCAEDYVIPNTNIMIENGTSVMIPILGLHYSKEFFPEPNKFDPDRFNEANIGNIKPYTYLPFGDGPRNCLGLRFGVIQSMVGLAALLNNFDFAVSTKTKMPFKFNARSFVLSTDGEMWLTAKKI